MASSENPNGQTHSSSDPQSLRILVIYRQFSLLIRPQGEAGGGQLETGGGFLTLVLGSG